MQRVFSSPEILLDVGHNELAAEAVAAYLEENKRSNTTCVLAMLADKPVGAVAHALEHVCRRWLCADSPGDRGQSGESLACRVRNALPDADVGFFGPLNAAMREAVSSVDKDETILVFGSFTTVSAAAGWLQNHMQRDRHDAAKIM
jgi:dihydrofolate synthase/folylpolyglutamate synthase